MNVPGISKNNQNLVHYLYCHAVRLSVYLNFCSVCLKSLALASKVQALALGSWP